MARFFLLWFIINTLVFSFGIDTDMVYQVNNKYIINGRIPRFVNKEKPLEELTPALKRVNKEIEDDFTKIKREVISSALQFAEEFPNSTLLPFTMNSSYVFTRNDNEVFSFVIETSYYTGGAHPNTVYKGYILTKDNYYELDDFFKDPKEARKYITDSIENSIEMNLLSAKDGRTKKVYFDHAKVDLDDATYYLKGNKIVILFQRYTISPYSSGNPEFEFTFEELRKFLKKGWIGYLPIHPF